jgi:hypothetical protein
MPPKRTLKGKESLSKRSTAATTPAKEGSPAGVADQPKTRVTFTFPMLQDLILLVLERDPWKVEHGNSTKPARARER